MNKGNQIQLSLLKGYGLFFLIFPLVFFISVSKTWGQSELGLGDIAFTGYMSSDPDQFSFVLLKEVELGTEIHFTDNGWLTTGGFRQGESTFTWRADETYACGTHIVIYSVPFSASLGTISQGTKLNLSVSGDQIFAYQLLGTNDLNSPNLIAAIQMNGAWDEDATSTNSSAMPDIFTNGQNTLAILPEKNNAVFDCAISALGPDQLRQKLADTENWDSGDEPLPLSVPCELTCTESCTINKATVVELSSCDEQNNSYTATIEISLSELAFPASMRVNDQTIDLNTNPQTFTLSDLVADGEPVNLEFWVTGTASCIRSFPGLFQAPSPCIPPPSLVINEIDYDQPGTDTAEFIELKNTGALPIDLSLAEVRLVNGSSLNPVSYTTISLDGMLLPADYYVICKSGSSVPNCDLEGFTSIQNGGTSPDAIALYYEDKLIDVLSYDGTIPGFSEGQGLTIIDDGNIMDGGLSRLPDGQDTQDNQADFQQLCISPGAANIASNTGCLPCQITGIEIGTQNECDPATNSTQQIIQVAYAQAPNNGSISLNGFLFPIETSPQEFALSLPSNGDTLDVDVFFTEVPNCSYELPRALVVPESCAPLPRIVINEVDYDQEGADDAEFIELKNIGEVPAFLDHCSIQLINGSSEPAEIYKTISLSGVLAPGEYYVVCNTGSTVPNCKLEGFTSLQNGGTSPDAIALYFQDVLLDKLSYSGSVPGFTEGEGITVPDDGGLAGVGLSRLPDGKDSDQNDKDFQLLCISPGMPNDSAHTSCLPCMISKVDIGETSACKSNNNTFTQSLTISYLQAPSSGKISVNGRLFDIEGSPQTIQLNQLMANGQAQDLSVFFTADSACVFSLKEAFQAPQACAPPPNIVINEIDYNQRGTDTREFIELKNMSSKKAILTGLQVVLINGTDAEPYKTYTFPSGTLPPWGYCVLCFSDSVPNCDIRLTGSLQNGPDVISLVYNAEQLDVVSYGGAVPGFTEGNIGLPIDDGNLVEQGFSRFPDGKDTDNNHEDFKLLCATPGEANSENATDCLPCSIKGVHAISQSPCNPEDGLYTQGIRISHFNAPNSGSLLVNGFPFTILPSPQDIFLPRLISNGKPTDLSVVFSNDSTCSLQVDSAFVAPTDCRPPCEISSVDILGQSICDTSNNAFQQDISLQYINPPFEGQLIVNGQVFEIQSSPQVISLQNLISDGRPKHLQASFSSGACNYLLDSAFVAPKACVELPKIVINEIDYDQPGSDSTEFVELKNLGPTSVSLQDLALLLINGSTGLPYDEISLPPDTLTPGGYYVICFGNERTYCNLQVTGSLQNGSPDGIQVAYKGIVIDGLSYEGDLANVTEGVALEAQDNGEIPRLGLSRFPDGRDTENNSIDFRPLCVSPGEANSQERRDCLPCEIKGIQTITIGETFGCNPLTQTFSQTLTLTYTYALETDSLIVNGQVFPVTGSPQLLHLANLSSNGNMLTIKAQLQSSPECEWVQDLPLPNVLSCSDEGPIPSIVINEIDYDQPGADTAEFIELKNIGERPIPLNGIRIELINGLNGTLYGALPLSGDTLAAGGYYVLCGDSTNTLNCNQILPFSLQNGSPDALRLMYGDSLLDALSYEGSVDGAVEASGIGLVDAGEMPLKGLSRYPDGADSNQNHQDFREMCISPGTANVDTTGNCSPCNFEPLVQLGPQSSCNTLNNNYGQEIVVEWQNVPLEDSFLINGQLFPVTNSPKSVFLQGFTLGSGAVSLQFSLPSFPECKVLLDSVFVVPNKCPQVPIEQSLVINEVDYEQPGADNAEFIELKNMGTDSLNLQNISLRLLNGKTKAVYQQLSLYPTILPPGGFYVICNDSTTVPNCNDPRISSIQNGPSDGIEIVREGILLDQLVYEADSSFQNAKDSYLLTDPDDVIALGISRFEATDSTDKGFALKCISPGAENLEMNQNCIPCPLSIPAPIQIQICKADTIIALDTPLPIPLQGQGNWFDASHDKMEGQYAIGHIEEGPHMFYKTFAACPEDTAFLHIKTHAQIEGKILQEGNCNNFPEILPFSPNVKVGYTISSNGPHNGFSGEGLEASWFPALGEVGEVIFTLSHPQTVSDYGCSPITIKVPFTCKEPNLVINEVEHLPFSPSEGQFIELKNTSGDTLGLRGIQLVIFQENNQPGDLPIRIELGGMPIHPLGYYVVCLGNDRPYCDQVVPQLLNKHTASIGLSIQDQVFESVKYGAGRSKYGEGKALPNSLAQRNIAFSRIPDGIDSQNNWKDFLEFCTSPGLANDTLACQLFHGDSSFKVSALRFSMRRNQEFKEDLKDFIDLSHQGQVTFKVLERPNEGEFSFSSNGQFSFIPSLASPEIQGFSYKVCEESPPYRCRNSRLRLSYYLNKQLVLNGEIFKPGYKQINQHA